MSIIIAIVLSLAAIAASPETEADSFAVEVITRCRPVATADFVGCEMGPPESETEDETSYAGWSHGEPITGP